MKKFEALIGTVVWMTVSLLMAAAALEPVEVKARTVESQASLSACPDGSAQLAMGCETIHL